jgi:hypothetical protein
MSKVKIKDANLICRAIDGAVVATGYPVTGQVLESIGVDRATIRAMKRKGLVKSVGLSLKSKSSSTGNVQHIIGYYTDNAYPAALAAHLEVKEEAAAKTE